MKLYVVILFLPKSSSQMHWISARFNEMDDMFSKTYRFNDRNNHYWRIERAKYEYSSKPQIRKNMQGLEFHHFPLLFCPLLLFPCPLLVLTFPVLWSKGVHTAVWTDRRTRCRRRVLDENP